MEMCLGLSDCLSVSLTSFRNTMPPIGTMQALLSTALQAECENLRTAIENHAPAEALAFFAARKLDQQPTSCLALYYTRRPGLGEPASVCFDSVPVIIR